MQLTPYTFPRTLSAESTAGSVKKIIPATSLLAVCWTLKELHASHDDIAYIPRYAAKSKAWIDDHFQSVEAAQLANPLHAVEAPAPLQIAWLDALGDDDERVYAVELTCRKA